MPFRKGNVYIMCSNNKIWLCVSDDGLFQCLANSNRRYYDRTGGTLILIGKNYRVTKRTTWQKIKHWFK